MTFLSSNLTSLPLLPALKNFQCSKPNCNPSFSLSAFRFWIEQLNFWGHIWERNFAKPTRKGHFSKAKKMFSLDQRHQLQSMWLVNDWREEEKGGKIMPRTRSALWTLSSFFLGRVGEVVSSETQPHYLPLGLRGWGGDSNILLTSENFREVSGIFFLTKISFQPSFESSKPFIPIPRRGQVHKQAGFYCILSLKSQKTKSKNNTTD